MGNESIESLREHTSQCAKNFKAGWIELGRALYSIWKDKSYKEWGYSTFEAYTSKEINIRKPTALKLLRSYFFLEKEEPQYLQEEFQEDADAASMPSYEAIDVLRLAKSKKNLEAGDYQNLKRNIFQKGKDVREVKKDLTALMRQREELSPEEAWEKRRTTSLKRLLSSLKSLRTELESSKMISAATIKEITALIDKVEVEAR